MCLGIPAKVISVAEENAEVEVGSVKRKIVLLLDEEINIGDWVLLHAGFGISKLSPEDAISINKALRGEI
jgi:hydrogenase expression/formation protein HypC